MTDNKREKDSPKKEQRMKEQRMKEQHTTQRVNQNMKELKKQQHIKEQHDTNDERMMMNEQRHMVQQRAMVNQLIKGIIPYFVNDLFLIVSTCSILCSQNSLLFAFLHHEAPFRSLHAAFFLFMLK